MAYVPDLDYVDDAPPGFDTARMTKMQLGIADAHTIAEAASTAADQALADARGKVDQDAVVYRALDHGAVGDGVKDDGPALNALIRTVRDAGGGVVLLTGTPTGYAVGSLTLESGVEVRGQGAVQIVKSGSSPTWINCAVGATDVTLSGVTLDALGLVSSYMVEVSTDVIGFRMENCSLLSTGGNGSQGLETRDRVSRAIVRGCHFDGMRTGVRINRDGDGITITECEFTQWLDRAIYLFGTATHASRNIWFTNNTIRPHQTIAGYTRQPIQTVGDDSMPHRHVHINGNTIIGAGTDYEDPATPGSADLISVHRADGFEVCNNIVTDGGDVGITIAQQARNGTVSGNVAMRNDSAGLCIGSVNSTEVRNIAVTGNVCVNNGQDRMGATGTPDYVRCGIRFARAVDCTAVGNALGDDQETGTQLYGVSLVDSANVHLAGNTDSNATALHYLEGAGNTGITQATTEPVV